MVKETTSVSIDSKWKEIISAHDEVNFSGAANKLAKSLAKSVAEGEGVEVDSADDVLLEMARTNREEAREELEDALETFNHWDSVLQDALEEQQEAREKRDECAEEVASFFPSINPEYQTADNAAVEAKAEKCDLTPKQLLKKAHLDHGLTLATHIELDDVELPEDDEAEPVAELGQADDVVQHAREAVNAD